VAESINQEPGHWREAHPIPSGGGRGYFAACLRGIGRPDEDRHPVLLMEPLRESDMVDVAVGKQQRSDMDGGSSHCLELAQQVLPMAAQVAIDGCMIIGRPTQHCSTRSRPSNTVFGFPSTSL
jgi:hypothetical protein